MSAPRPRLAVWKLASCDGCQLSLLDCEDELVAVAGAVEIAWFPEATSTMQPGPYDFALVEGSVTTADDVARLHRLRADSKVLVTIGACATAGGVQALRNLADIDDYLRVVYANPEYVSTLATSTAVAEHVPVDFELRGCPIDRGQLLELVNALLNGRRPDIARHSLCVDCKLLGNVCVTVADGIACLGPVTQTGCGALCPAVHRGCYGCFGPSEDPDMPALTVELRRRGVEDSELVRLLRTFNAHAEPFRAESERIEAGR